MLIAHRVVVGVEEHAVLRKFGDVIVGERPRRKVSKNQVVCARCHLTGLASGMDWAWQSSGDKVAARSTVICLTER
jgi:hypothetical protein